MRTATLRPRPAPPAPRRAARRPAFAPRAASARRDGGGVGDAAGELARAFGKKVEAGFTAASAAFLDAARSTWTHLDDRFALRSKARAAAADAARLAPHWQRRAAAFARSPAARPAAIGAIFLLAVTGLLGRVLNILFLLWWLAPIVFLPLAARDAERRAAEAQRAQARARWGPAADWVDNLRRGAGGNGGGEKGGGQIIDVEWSDVDKN